MCVLHFFTIPWEVVLFGSHFQMVLRNLTTNEMVNVHRYSHFWKEVEVDPHSLGPHSNPHQKYKARDFHNPFDKGSAWLNFLDFFYYRNRGSTLEEAKAIGQPTAVRPACAPCCAQHGTSKCNANAQAGAGAKTKGEYEMVSVQEDRV